MVETGFTGGASVKSGVGIEERMGDGDAETFEKLEGGFKMVRQLPGIVMISRNDVGAGDDKAIPVSNRENI